MTDPVRVSVGADVVVEPSMAERTGGLGELSKWRSSDLHCRIWLPLWELARCWIYRLVIDIATTDVNKERERPRETPSASVIISTTLEVRL